MIRKRLLRPTHLVYMYLSIPIIGLILSVAIGRIDLMYRAMYLIVPLLIASYIILKHRMLQVDIDENTTSCIQINNIRPFLLIFVILYFFTILSLTTSSTRSPIYFMLIILLITTLFTEIIMCDTSKKLISNIILFQIILISVNMIWGVTLNYELYFGGTDTVAHMRLIDIILTQNHLTKEIGPYLYYPLYHLLLAVGIELLNIPKFQTMFLVSGLIFQVGIVISYLVIKLLSRNNKLALLSTLLLMSSQDYIYYGTYVITRTLAAIIFMLIFYISLKNIGEKRLTFKFIFLFFVWILILYHHVSLLFILIIISVFYLLDIFFPTPTNSKIFTVNQLAIIAINFLFYAFFVAISFSTSALTMTFKSEVKEEIILGVPSLINVKIFLLEHVSTSIFVFFYLLGTYFILNDHNNSPNIKKVTLFTLIFLPIYIPSPIQSLTFFNELLRFDRWSFLISPFMFIVMGFGILYILERYDSKKIVPIMMSLMILFSFFSLMHTSNAPDLPIFKDKSMVSNRYFTISELNAITFMHEKTSHGPYFSDYFVYRLLGEKPIIYIIDENNLHIGSDGYILIRDREWISRNLLFLEKDMYPLRTVMNIKTNETEFNLKKKNNIIFNSYITKIYYGE